MCQFPGSASETFPLTVNLRAVNNGALIHTHQEKKALELFFSRNLTVNVWSDSFRKTNPLLNLHSTFKFTNCSD